MSPPSTRSYNEMPGCPLIKTLSSDISPSRDQGTRGQAGKRTRGPGGAGTTGDQEEQGQQDKGHGFKH